MDNDNSNDGGIECSLTGMEKPCKLFITIDKEGFLMDSVAISDVVNFDCYESISRSAKRIIALFSNSKPDDIIIAALFYYKKRARSTRMNPVPLLTTTDGFRAVAEHPSGEVPLGVDWLKKVATGTVVEETIVTVKREAVSPETTKHDDKTVEKAVSAAALKYNLTRKTEKKTETPSIPEKKRKLDPANNYKTYMPGVTKISESASSALNRLDDVIAKADDIRKQVLSTNTPPQTEVLGEEVKKGTSSTLRSSKTNYHWAGNVTCEVVFSYDGVSERRKLNPDLSAIVHSFVKGDFSALKPDVQRKVYNGEGNLNVPDKLAQDQINDANQNYPLHDKQKPIKYLSDAKLDIFRVLTLLQLSKARFKDLLSWMKTLKLEEGKQGKFYLSERNVVGERGLRVNYDTDEQAAAKLNLIHKSRLKSNQNSKVLHSVVPSLPVATSTSLATTRTDIMMHNTVTGMNEQFARPIMLMMPSSNSNVVTTSALPTTVHGGQSLIPLTVLQQDVQPNPQVSSKESSKESSSAGTQTFIVKNTAARGVSLLSSSAATTTTTEKRDQLPSRTRKVPNILSNKSNLSSHKPTPPTDDPVPIGLYRSSYKTNLQPDHGDDLNETVDPTLPIIKQEPMDTNGDHSCEFEKPSDEDSSEGYNNVLKSDDRMLLAVDNPELDMELVIKTEPVDDYDN